MREDLKIVIPVFSKNLLGKSFAADGRNPGVGGTQYVSIVLALLLAKKFPDIQLKLVNNDPILLCDAPSNLKVELAADINAFLSSMVFVSCNTLVVCPVSLLLSVEYRNVARLRESIIAWVHHPFQFDLRLIKFKPAAYVHVGAYQYFSNSFYYKNNWQINNPFVLPGDSSNLSAPDANTKIRIVCLGALNRAKGFGHIARQWSSIKKLLPEVELHVIGSSETYGKRPEHLLIPCDLDFAEEILRYIPLRDIEERQVVFHGNLGKEKFQIMRSAHLAVLNPTGSSEAFPASTLECMACGLPVIASDDYGMSDTMRFFPELILRSPEDIPALVQFLISDPYRYEELSARSIAVATWFHSQTDVIMARWRRLFDFACSKGVLSEPDRPPVEAIYGSRLKLIFRQFKVPLASLSRSILMKFINL